MTRRSADLAAATAFGVFAAVFLFEGRDLSFTTDRGVPGAGFFPLLTAFATAVLSVVLAAQAFRRSTAPTPAAERADELPSDSTVLADQTGLESLHAISEHETPMENEEPASQTRTVLVFLLVLGAALLLPVLGFIPGMLLLSCGIMFAVERRFDPVSIATAVLLPLLTYGLFGLLLDVRLPLGPFE